VLKKKCPAVDTIIQYKAGAGGALMWTQMNQLPGDGLNVVGINLPHIVFQPIEGEVQYKTADITPVFWFHYTPDILVVPESKARSRTSRTSSPPPRPDPGKMSLGGSGLNSANHAAHERLNAAFGIKSTYVPFKGTGDMATGGDRRAGRRRDDLHAFRHRQQGPGAAAGGGHGEAPPLMPDVPTFKELGVDWVDGAYRGIGVPKSTPPEARKRLSDTWPRAEQRPEMKDLAAKNGFELVNVGTDQMDAFMKERIRIYTEGAQRLGLGKK
jgi:tripartite-type tricarboxylate transporter receptor subunit TctC